MWTIPEAHELLAGLVGRTVKTPSGRQNRVLELGKEHVLVGTGRSPSGEPIPVSWVQQGLDRLAAEGEVEVTTATLEHRSAFVAAVLLTLPGATAYGAAPTRIRLDEQDGYRAAVAGRVNAWWENDSAERYWLEITDRPDIGVDLHAPQRDAQGNRTAGYSLLWWVEPGDVVFHYDRNRRAIVAWSRAVGEVVEAPVVWLSHRAATRRRIGEARRQAGWWLDLDGRYELDEPVSLGELRERGSEIRAALDELRSRHSGSLYFPFFFYGDRELRPMQPYLNKLPASVVALLPSLAAAAQTAAATHPLVGRPPKQRPASEAGRNGLGTAYRKATTSDLVHRDPFIVDPAVVERGLAGHADTQNALAMILTAAGLVPRSPSAHEPNFDLAWQQGEVVFVAEVKSITLANEERQLRLGLGQVLRYRALLHRYHHEVRSMLVVERAPSDSSWIALCEDLGVVLAWPERFHELISPPPFL
jgi:hypothetical protein